MKFQTIGLLILTLGLCASAQAQAEKQDTILVCRGRQCAATTYSMTRGFLFNKLVQLVNENKGKNILLCEADSFSHVCLKEGITVPATSAMTAIDLVIPSVKLADSKMIAGQSGLDLILDYKVYANQTAPACQLGLSRLTVDYVDKVELTTNDFTCQITETGKTDVNVSFNIDYIDFDYGFLGGWYTVGVGETVQGDASGYVMMRMTNMAPLEPDVEVLNMAEQIIEVKPEQKWEYDYEYEVPLPPEKNVVIETKPEILEETEPVEVVEEPVAEEPVVIKPKQAPEVIKPQVKIEYRPRTIKTTVTEKTVIVPDSDLGDVIPPMERTEIPTTVIKP